MEHAVEAAQRRPASIDRRKITDYCLNLDHDDGSHKARLFQTLVGLNQSNSTLLLHALRSGSPVKAPDEDLW